MKVYQVSQSTGSRDGHLFSNLKKAWLDYCQRYPGTYKMSYSQVALKIKQNGMVKHYYSTFLGNDECYVEIWQRMVK